MKRFFSLFVISVLAFMGGCKKEEPAQIVSTEQVENEETFGTKKLVGEAMEVKMPVVAGTFYPLNPSKLAGMIDEFLSNAKKVELQGRVVGLIAPHAGYIYSGPVAGWAFKQVEGESYDVVVVLGPTHFVPLDGVSVLLAKKYKTPLGEIPIDLELSEKMINYEPWITFDPSVYHDEHSLEVELPFIQRTLKPGYKLVMIAVGTYNFSRLQRLSEILVELLAGKKALVVASTDLSHYHPYDVANQLDLRAIDLIKSAEAKTLFEEAKGRDIELCGMAPVVVLMEFFKLIGGDKSGIAVLKYLNSGDTAGDKMRVVGYGAVAFSVKEGLIKKAKANPAEQLWDLTNEEKKKLLEIARTTLVEYITNRKIPDFEVPSGKLTEKGAAFVTLKSKGELRGCIGHVVAQKPLYLCVRDMTIAASTEDPRFPPVTPAELSNISIEISVLTPMQKVKDVSEIEVGRDGLVIKRGFYSGLLLPQVPVEYGWDRETFLKQTCLKAGLPTNAWKDPATEIYKFQAVVFGED